MHGKNRNACINTRDCQLGGCNAAKCGAASLIGAVHKFLVWNVAVSYTHLVAAAQTTIVPLMAAGVFYYLFNLLVAFVMETLEKKMAYYR